MSAIDQFVAGFANGDAISNEAIVMRRIFRSWGYESEIFCESKRILPELRREARDLSEYQSLRNANDVALLHLSIGSAVNDLFASLKSRKAILYHNVTPAHYFTMINKQISNDLSKGREQMKRLAGVAQVNMADSNFNALELKQLGYGDVQTLPLILDLEKLRGEPDAKILRKFGDGRTNILFVGRCAPNKRIEDLGLAFYHYHNSVDPNSRLIHVGSNAGTERYFYLLLARTKELGLDSVYFAGAVPQAQVNAFYQCSDVFLSMSEHEGFCIPLIESMVNDLPVMAYSAAATPETMDGAGILFSEKKYELIAEMMGRVTGDEAFRNAVLNGQRERLRRFTSRDPASELKQLLAPLLK
jgi:L-malate glycosyltransferase